MKHLDLVAFGVAGLVAAATAQMACSPIGQRGGGACDDIFNSNECTETGSGGSGQTSSNGSGGTIFNPATSGTTSSGGVVEIDTCGTDPNVDNDGDGATENQGDCKDCDKNIGPGAIEVLTDLNDPSAKPSDENCDGYTDNVATYCDDNLAFDNTDPANGVRAVDICQFVGPGELKWGVLSTMYVRSNGAPTAVGPQAGLLSNFGPNVNVQGGSRMLAISSGRARLPGQGGGCTFPADYSCVNTGGGIAPPGFPQDPLNCDVEPNIFDDIGLEVRLRTPTNATGYTFNFKFYSFEFPEFVCKSYNDQFISLINPAPVGSVSGNISFDSAKNPVSVNIAFFDVCQYNSFYPQFPCPAGPGELQGSGFGVTNDAGATKWLQSQAPVTGGQELIIRWTIWDTGDTSLDSTALVDNFQWIANGGTVIVGTTPVPVPK